MKIKLDDKHCLKGDQYSCWITTESVNSYIDRKIMSSELRVILSTYLILKLRMMLRKTKLLLLVGKLDAIISIAGGRTVQNEFER